MAELPSEITITVLELQRQLLSNIHKTTATPFMLLESYGETEHTILITLEKEQILIIHDFIHYY